MGKLFDDLIDFGLEFLGDNLRNPIFGTDLDKLPMPPLATPRSRPPNLLPPPPGRQIAPHGGRPKSGPAVARRPPQTTGPTHSRRGTTMANNRVARVSRIPDVFRDPGTGFSLALTGKPRRSELQRHFDGSIVYFAVDPGRGDLEVVPQGVKPSDLDKDVVLFVEARGQFWRYKRRRGRRINPENGRAAVRAAKRLTVVSKHHADVQRALKKAIPASLRTTRAPKKKRR